MARLVATEFSRLKRGSLAVPQLCQAKGFVCEFCGNEKDIIFPFQLHKCQRCEGEHAPPGAGPAGARGPLPPRPSVSLTWRDWKIPKARRLSNVLSRDMREGEGGERLQGVTHRARGVEDEDEEEEEEQEGGKEHQKGGDEGGGGHHRKVGTALGEPPVRREANLLKMLHLGRLKKRFSRGESESEGVESQEEAAQEKKKHLWSVPKLKVFSRSSPTRDREGGGNRGAEEEEEGRDLQEEEEEEEEAEGSEAVDKTPETERPSAEKLSVLRRFGARKVAAVLSRGRTVEEDEVDRDGESDGETGTGGEQAGATIVTRKTWRGRNTRRARRISRGKKTRDPTEGGSQSEGRDSPGGGAGGSESTGSPESGQSQAARQREEG